MGPNPMSGVYLSRGTFKYSYTQGEDHVMTEAEVRMMSL